MYAYVTTHGHARGSLVCRHVLQADCAHVDLYTKPRQLRNCPLSTYCCLVRMCVPSASEELWQHAHLERRDFAGVIPTTAVRQSISPVNSPPCNRISSSSRRLHRFSCCSGSGICVCICTDRGCLHCVALSCCCVLGCRLWQQSAVVQV